jgi:hypothetical protein
MAEEAILGIADIHYCKPMRFQSKGIYMALKNYKILDASIDINSGLLIYVLNCYKVVC